MKVLLVYGNCTIGGVQNLHLDLCREYLSRGIEVEFFWFARGNLVEHLPKDVPSHFGSLGDLLLLIERSGFDIVQCAVWDLDLGLDAVKLLEDPPKVIATIHATPCPGWHSRNCDALVGVSQAMVQMQQPVTNCRVSLIRNGVDTGTFFPAKTEVPERPIVGWVGRASDINQKRIDRLAAISGRLKREGIDIWVASADSVDEVPDRDTRRMLKETCDQWGCLNKQEMSDFYRSIAASGGLLLMTSDYEGFGLNLAEAQACACPVLAPEIDGVVDCVSTHHGGMLYPKTYKDNLIANEIVSVISKKSEMQERGISVANHAKAYLSLARMATEYLDLYQRSPLEPISRRPPARMLISKSRHRGGLRRMLSRAHDKQRAALQLSDAGHFRVRNRLRLAAVRECFPF